MSDEKEQKKPLQLNRPGKLELKKTVESGQVRQSFSHGRSKAVTVEVKRSRTFARSAGGRMTEVTESRQIAEEALAATRKQPEEEIGTELRALTASERAARAQALEQSRQDEDERQANEAEAKIRAEAEAKRRAEELPKEPEAAEALAVDDQTASAGAAESTPDGAAEAQVPAPPKPGAEEEAARARRRGADTEDASGGRIKRKT
ncbi:MAG: translation initiation factor IF-2 associated domain-containing protein, partial [Alphaproteobacteria bacterium]